MEPVLNNITVIGAGAWGTALAETLSRAGRKVTIYAREPEIVESINSAHENTGFLKGIPLDHKLRAVSDPAAAVKGAELILLVPPAQYVRDTLAFFKLHLGNIPVINCAKGIETATGKFLSEVAAEILPGHPYGVLSGPTFADEVARGLPTAVTLATKADEKTAMLWASSMRGKAFRPYLSRDIVGVEIGGAVKNVIAIACGIVEGRSMGKNARAAVMTRGMAEIHRLGTHCGAEAETFLGLSGFGDLTLTCNSMSSRNFSLGFELGQGKSLEDIMAARNTVAEGVTTAQAVAGYASKYKVDMPICLGVNAVLHHKAVVDDVIGGLLSRDLKTESD